MRRALVTGGAGFIGSSMADRLLAEGWHVTCLDNFDAYYDECVKRRNIEGCLKNPEYRLVQADIRDFTQLEENLDGDYDVIIHFAAKAGVRQSISDPLIYQQVNVCGTQNMLEFARIRNIRQFLFASSSSVYGINPNVPWSEEDLALMPISPYASSKASGEILGHVYSYI
jgi:UDP-glucuronate 4-epimerase